jgi:hypothetical protein
MSKKLDELLEAIERFNLSGAICRAYDAYMEESKTIPQPGQEIEVTNSMEWGSTPKIEKFIGFKSDGTVITESECGEVDYWDYYRIPTPKKKYKVVKDTLLGFMILPFNTPMPNAEIITTFED